MSKIVAVEAGCFRLPLAEVLRNDRIALTNGGITPKTGGSANIPAGKIKGVNPADFRLRGNGRGVCVLK